MTTNCFATSLNIFQLALIPFWESQFRKVYYSTRLYHCLSFELRLVYLFHRYMTWKMKVSSNNSDQSYMCVYTTNCYRCWTYYAVHQAKFPRWSHTINKFKPNKWNSWSKKINWTLWWLWMAEVSSLLLKIQGHRVGKSSLTSTLLHCGWIFSVSPCGHC